jgi:prepilin-type processing-associated H-X9-DG protein
MQEDLLGYLLGALEPDEMRRVEQWLREDAGARQELADLERILQRLEDADESEMTQFIKSVENSESIENSEFSEDVADIDLVPPADLISRTLASLPPLPQPAESNSESANVLGHSVGAGAENLYGELSLSSTSEGGSGATWRWQDWGASITAAAVLIAIVIPSLAEGRFAARKAACQDHLRDLGVAMTQFASRNAQSRLPSVAPAGYQAFAGVYAPRLRDAGLLDDPTQTLCPSISPNEFWPGNQLADARLVNQSFSTTEPLLASLQTLDEIGRELTLAGESFVRDAATNQRVMQAIEELRYIQMTAGGHYAYTLGVREGDHFSSPRFEGRSQFAVMSDAAITRTTVIQRTSTDQPTYQVQVLSHGGRGINVLYEDGHVGFLPSEALNRMPDNPLVNNDGLSEAGLTLDDASLAPSWQPPFSSASQR